MNWDEYFYYDETSPSCLRWKEDRCSGRWKAIKHVNAGDKAGSLSSKGYWCVQIGKFKYKVHRVVAEMFGHDVENMQIDHINNDKQDNRICNLRVVDNKTNVKNKRKYSNNKLGVTGVYKFKRGNSFVANWKDLSFNTRSKAFSITKHGEEEAFRLACEHRAKMIEELNRQGAGYTENHGK